MADNPITTVEQGMFHFEYRTYPEVALREALMNALCHADYRIAGPILVKQFPRKVEISNPGGFVGGISPQNILHHAPVARNPLLVDALTRLRLINRSNLGVPRMFSALLIEGKEPPLIDEQGEAVKVTFLARELSVPFRLVVAEEGQQGRILSVDPLLILQYLLRHREVDTSTAAKVCQREEQKRGRSSVRWSGRAVIWREVEQAGAPPGPFVLICIADSPRRGILSGTVASIGKQQRRACSACSSSARNGMSWD
jgi:ATP-dependent DNA helicase RecG